MKNIKIKLVVTILMVLTMFSIFGIVLYAYEGDTEYKTVAEYHFKKTSDNIPYNHHGTCTHVAMTSLLFYYDVYWDDIFVDPLQEKLDDAERFLDEDLPYRIPHLVLENSQLSISQKNNKGAYLDFARAESERYLHMNLITLADELGYYQGESDSISLGINFTEAAYVLDKYFDDLFGEGNYYREDGTCDNTLPINVYVIMESSSGDNRPLIMSKMREELDRGNPLLYCGFTVDKNGVTYTPEGIGRVGHTMVAYKEQDDGDIVFHKGHTNNTVDTLNSTIYKFDIGILWIQINEGVFPHSCSDDYWVGDDKACSCQVYGDLHSEHIHELGEYLTYGTQYHRYKCMWDDEIVLESHNFTYQQISDTSHLAICACGYTCEESHSRGFYTYHDFRCECGYAATTPHQYVYQDITESTHTAVCACGDCYTEIHHYKIKQLPGEQQHLLVCDCGYSKEENHSYSYRSAAEGYHALACVCGDVYAERHQYSFEPISNDEHIGTCACGDSYEEEHELVLTELSDEIHIYICKCGHDYEQEHSLLYWQKSVANHTFICACGYSYTEPHNFIEQDYHTSVCDDCGETVTTPHESEVYEQLSATQHLVVCGCGYEGEAPHLFTCVSISASMHRMTCVCGYTTLDIHNFSSSVINPRYQTCTECGYTRDNFGPGGGNVIMGKEEDEETTE